MCCSLEPVGRWSSNQTWPTVRPSLCLSVNTKKSSLLFACCMDVLKKRKNRFSFWCSNKRQIGFIFRPHRKWDFSRAWARRTNRRSEKSTFGCLTKRNSDRARARSSTLIESAAAGRVCPESAVAESFQLPSLLEWALPPFLPSLSCSEKNKLKMSSSEPVKRIFDKGWELLPVEEQTMRRERLRALAAKDSEKSVKEVGKSLFSESSEF